MKVVMVTPKFKPAMGGAEEYIYQLSKRLMERGHNVIIYTSDLLNTFPGYSYVAKGALDYDGIPVRRFHAYRLLRNYPVTPGIIPSLLQERADIIHTHVYGQFTTDITALVGTVRHIPLFLTPHGTFSFHHPLKTPYIQVSKISTLKAFKKIICLSTGEVKQFSQLTNPDKIVKIPIGVDIDFWQDLREGSFRHKYKIKGFLIASVGRLIFRKGFQYLLQAMPVILERFPETTVVIAGENFGYLQELRALANELKVDKSVIFTGPLSNTEVRELFADADVVAIPSIYGEGFPVVQIEAMAVGKPIVASIGDWLPDTFKHGENGLLVEPGDSTGLAKAIITLSEDNSLSARMGGINRQQARKYSWDKIAENIESVYF